jgi:hypothetical protein
MQNFATLQNQMWQNFATLQNQIYRDVTSHSTRVMAASPQGSAIECLFESFAEKYPSKLTENK